MTREVGCLCSMLPIELSSATLFLLAIKVPTAISIEFDQNVRDLVTQLLAACLSAPWPWPALSVCTMLFPGLHLAPLGAPSCVRSLALLQPSRKPRGEHLSLVVDMIV